jgi:hypothetical protein
MATALDSPRVKTQAIAPLPQSRPAPISVEPERTSQMPAEDAETGLDWILIRLCIACGLLLVAMLVHEFIRWVLG